MCDSSLPLCWGVGSSSFLQFIEYSNMVIACIKTSGVLGLIFLVAVIISIVPPTCLPSPEERERTEQGKWYTTQVTEGSARISSPGHLTWETLLVLTVPFPCLLTVSCHVQGRICIAYAIPEGGDANFTENDDLFLCLSCSALIVLSHCKMWRFLCAGCLYHVYHPEPGCLPTWKTGKTGNCQESSQW